MRIKYRLLCAVLLITGGLACLRLLRSRDASLLDASRRIPHTSQWLPYPHTITWFDDHHLFYLTPGAANRGWEEQRLDLDTGRAVAQGSYQGDPLLVSPQGRWHLRSRLIGFDYHFYLTSADGNAHLHFRSAYPHGRPELAWTPDGNYLVELNPQTSTDNLRLYPLSEGKAMITRSVHLNLNYFHLLGVTSENELLVPGTPANIVNATPVPFDTFPVCYLPIAANLPVRVAALRFPHATLGGNLALSPQGDRIAMFFRDSHQPFGYDKCRWLYNALHIKPSETVSLWISRSDGSNMRELGKFAINDRESSPYTLLWTPTSRHLSFLFRDTLFIVLAPALK